MLSWRTSSICLYSQKSRLIFISASMNATNTSTEMWMALIIPLANVVHSQCKIYEFLRVYSREIHSQPFLEVDRHVLCAGVSLSCSIFRQHRCCGRNSVTKEAPKEFISYFRTSSRPMFTRSQTSYCERMLDALFSNDHAGTF